MLVLLAPSVLAASRTCSRLADPALVDQSVRLCSDNYYPYDYPEGVRITADDVVFDCGSAVLHGKFKNAGIVIENRKNVHVRNCQVANYETGIRVKNSVNVTIFNANLVRNYVGILIVDSSGVVVEQSMDISIKRPVQAINSRGNTFHYVNKKLEGDQCRLNQCNTPTGMFAVEQSAVKENAPKKALRRVLMDNIRKWLFA